MPVGERAALGARREIGAQPLLLGRARPMRDLAVQRDDMPGAEVVTVVALGGITRRGPEVAEVAGRVVTHIVVIPGDRAGARLVAAPGGRVAVGVVATRPVGIGVVAQREHGARDRVHQIRGERIPAPGAVGDISGAHHDHGRGNQHSQRIRPGASSVVGDSDAHAVLAFRRVDVRRRDRRGGCRARARGAVTPRDRVRPGCVAAAPRIGEADREADRRAGAGGEIGAGVHGQRRRTVAAVCARVAESLTGDGHELPRVATVVERELQHTERPAVADLAVEADMIRVLGISGAPRADDELANPERGVLDLGGGLGREPFIERVVRVDDDVDTSGVQRVPQRADVGVGRILGIEQRVVPVGDSTACRMGGEVGAQPLLLGRACGRGDARAAAVEHDDVPSAEVVAVVTLRGIARGGAEVAEIARGIGRLVVPVAGRRARARLLPPPVGVVTLLVLGERALVEGVVAVREHGARDVVEQRGRRLVCRPVAAADVPRADEGDGSRSRQVIDDHVVEFGSVVEAAKGDEARAKGGIGRRQLEHIIDVRLERRPNHLQPNFVPCSFADRERLLRCQVGERAVDVLAELDVIVRGEVDIVPVIRVLPATKDSGDATAIPRQWLDQCFDRIVSPRRAAVV